jgi:hypothetical protein
MDVSSNSELGKRMQSALDVCLQCACSEINGCHHNINKCHKWAPVGKENGAAWHSGGRIYTGQAEEHYKLLPENRCKCKCRFYSRRLCSGHPDSDWITWEKWGPHARSAWEAGLNELAEEITGSKFYSPPATRPVA